MGHMSGDLSERVIVIVGGTAGIGLSAALAVIAAGGRVVAVGRDDDYAAEAARAVGPSGLVIRGDANESHTADAAITQAVARFGRFDALYHVAGGSGRRAGDGPIHEVTDAGIDATLAMNLASVLYSNRAAARHFIEHRTPGVVLNMTSVLAASPSPHYFATHVYAAAKAAIVGLTRSCAAHYAPQNIRFNAIAPGLVDTPMARRAAQDPLIQQFIRTKQPLDGGRIGRPEDLDAAAVFLLSDASRFITGQVLTVDGGWSVSEGQLSRGD
jgi:NAD(P)-dependent dehydrogenase (short-subunit alcohol dehydrogenase family)